MQRGIGHNCLQSQKYNPDIIVYEVGVEQRLLSAFCCRKILNLINDDVELVHTAHGLYLAPTAEILHEAENNKIGRSF